MPHDFNNVLAVGSILQIKPQTYIDPITGNINDFNIVDVRMLNNSKLGWEFKTVSIANLENMPQFVLLKRE